MNPKEAFNQFEHAVAVARLDSGKKDEMRRLFIAAVSAAGKTRKDLIEASITNLATIDRWFRGTVVPQANNVERLKEYLLGGSSDYGCNSLAAILLNPRFRPIIVFFLEEDGKGHALTSEQLQNLVWLAEKSVTTLSPEMMRAFLGISES